mmetsp:Transcript_24016/g.60760  ORF Transcript_24016/g.60760 Transcript_24016/m.60760 type:complete len:345 (-) Transcript_24016:3273-4307(-)
MVHADDVCGREPRAESASRFEPRRLGHGVPEHVLDHGPVRQHARGGREALAVHVCAAIVDKELTRHADGDGMHGASVHQRPGTHNSGRAGGLQFDELQRRALRRSGLPPPRHGVCARRAQRSARPTSGRTSSARAEPARALARVAHLHPPAALAVRQPLARDGRTRLVERRGLAARLVVRRVIVHRRWAAGGRLSALVAISVVAAFGYIGRSAAAILLRAGRVRAVHDARALRGGRRTATAAKVLQLAILRQLPGGRGLEHGAQVPLVVGVFADLLLEPRGVVNALHGVEHALARRRDGDDLLNGALEPLRVVLPVDHLAHVKVSHGGVAEPLLELLALDGLLR